MPKQIKQEEEQEFWEWCGFWRMTWMAHSKHEGVWHNPDDERIDGLPEIDIWALPYLFKYAVPKLLEEGVVFLSVLFNDWLAELEYLLDKDPALALYQAIQKARRTNERN